MNTKSAIKHLEKCKITDDKYKYCKLNQTWDNIISLLQQGEKYRQIIEELRDNYKIKHYYWISDGANDRKIYLGETLGKLEQKYFPEEVKQNEAER